MTDPCVPHIPHFKFHVLSIVPHVFFLAVLGDRDVPAVGLEFVLEELAKGVVLYAECVVQNRRDVILPANQDKNQHDETH